VSEAAPVIVGSLLAANRDAPETVSSTLKAVISQPEGEKVLWDVLATNVDAVNDSAVESVAVQIVHTLADHSYNAALTSHQGYLSAVTKVSGWVVLSVVLSGPASMKPRFCCNAAGAVGYGQQSCAGPGRKAERDCVYCAAALSNKQR
jgi:hypothetical protein